MTQQEKQAVVDDEHLRLLALFHYVFGGLGVAFALLGVLWTVFMATMFASSFPPAPDGASEEVARRFKMMPAFMMAVFGVMATFGVVYGVLQVFLPCGTMLSVFTFVVLERASVEQLYRDAQPGSGR